MIQPGKLSDMQQELREFKRQRNEALTKMDMEWARENLAHVLNYPTEEEVLLAAMHKARYECSDIDPALRHESREWLTTHRYKRLGGLPWPATGLPK